MQTLCPRYHLNITHFTPRGAAGPGHRRNPDPELGDSANSPCCRSCTMSNPKPQPASCLCPSLPQCNLPVHVSAFPTPPDLVTHTSRVAAQNGTQSQPHQHWEWSCMTCRHPKTEALTCPNKKSKCIVL